VVAQLSSLTVTPMIRDGRLVPLLTQQVADHMHLFAYNGSRKAQPARVRAFLDLIVKRLANSSQFVLTREELAAAETKARERLRS
jgi:DNA-binding transcriptional LysR family regulator